MFAALLLPCLALAANQASRPGAQTPTRPPWDATQYSVRWDSLLPEPGTSKSGYSTYQNAMPIGNGHIAANVLYEASNHSITAIIAASSAWGEGGDLLKVAILTIELNKPVPDNISQVLDPMTATFSLEFDEKLVAEVYIDANRDVLVVNASSPDIVKSASLAPIRTEPVTATPVFECRPYTTSADVWSNDGLFVYHRIANNANFMAETLNDTNIPLPRSFPDPFQGRATGAALGSGIPGTDGVLSVAVLTQERTESDDAFEKVLGDAARDAIAGSTPASRNKHDMWWSSRWGYHYISIPSQPTLSQMYSLQRYIQLTQARSPFPIKFNGMLFTANRPPNADYRQWGGLNWWQNLRMPYYNMAQAGDLDTLSTLFDQFNKTVPVARSRTIAYFGFDGLWWPEYTHALLGTTHPNSYGCGRAGDHSSDPTWHSNDRWNGYNRQGSLDLSLLIVDYINYVGQDPKNYRSIPAGVVDFYYNRWSNTSTGPSDPITVFPTQAVETWQCPGWPVDPTNCPTNDLPTVAGLRAVLQKLIQLPADLAGEEQRQKWADFLKIIPALPQKNGAHIPCDTCDESTSGPGCHKTSNVENAELYAVHPYRLATAARGDAESLYLATTAFERRRFKGDVGWNQNAMDAALLGNASNAAAFVLARAATPPAKGYRFPAFAPHEQDYEPSSDHYAVMSNALQYMLAAPTDSKDNGLLLLPAWPCEWDVDFRIAAPNKTVVLGSLKNGKLQYSVTPSARAGSVSARSCQKIGLV